MKILLVKCHKKTIFSKIEPIVTEPLELEYLSALLENLEIQHRVYDGLLEKGSFRAVFEAYEPDVLLLTGYITAVGKIIAYSQYAKKSHRQIKVIVGGVHAEINYEDFFVDTIDIIVHSNGLSTLNELLQHDFHLEIMRGLKGIALRHGDQWTVNESVPTALTQMPLPNRDYFEKHQHRTKYMSYSPVAIVKTALSCPHGCHFCYCKLLNTGLYATREINEVVEEISGIGAPYIWIVDDSFLLDRQRTRQFIEAIKISGIRKKFIAYSRVDFVVNNEDILQQLKEIGFIELIIGMEAVDDSMLKDFNKAATVDENSRTVTLLKKYDIKLTALFIVGIDFKVGDFKKMRHWIRRRKLQSFTVSIFTPMKGTQGYGDYEEKIQETDFSKFDFLHLTMKPYYMSKFSFYIQFYLIYGQLFFQSKSVRQYLFKNLKHILKPGGYHE
ncbi:Radical SAM domain protein [Alkaliphilus metalliredigens QYMF]|uniref:Radical SAM domain protein n=1 Tax=Alkaliphilus metalliredigens (strain QYMF) TaxID=293826 RepID=A6TTU7_ALKMQ|nr:B12-binding domain-containing radical SAM protein [Alkaliphilus metalliredigens]ABR49615.1 Radical SAM domain protein [Alkaliphilus metalliredigens QYMF]